MSGLRASTYRADNSALQRYCYQNVKTDLGTHGFGSLAMYARCITALLCPFTRAGKIAIGYSKGNQWASVNLDLKKTMRDRRAQDAHAVYLMYTPWGDLSCFCLILILP